MAVPVYTKSQQQIHMGAHILGESTIDMDSSVLRLGPSVRSGQEQGWEGGSLPERVDEAQNVIIINIPMAKLFGVADGRKEIPNRSESETRTWSTILLFLCLRLSFLAIR